jgi:CxxC motif-containing protein (DUF1111 family)
MRPALLLPLSLALSACGEPAPGAAPDASAPPRAGGDLTVNDTSRDAFTRPARALDETQYAQFFVGNSFFNQNWVSAPATTLGRDGLGPTFNAPSCSSCHFKDGRGAPPEGASEPFMGLLLRLSVPGESETGAPVPEPAYGGQFNHRAVMGVLPEGESSVRYEELPGAYADGESYSLRRPVYSFSGLNFGPMRDDIMVSPRVAPAVFGLGLLEAVDERTILALADEGDRDGDGISGRPNRVWSLRARATVLGRFGWKANQPSLEQQDASAFVGDLGVTSELLPAQNCPAPQSDCQRAPHGGEPEIDASKLAAVTLYTQALAVPARRDLSDPAVMRGEALFREARCVACHVETLRSADVFPSLPLLARQTFHPYTDLLLHDLGDGLADDRPDFLATGREWRTAPLWGTGLIETVNRHTYLLHDGRARGHAEAILWHDGEARASRDAFRAMPRADRDALLTFLRSL